MLSPTPLALWSRPDSCAPASTLCPETLKRLYTDTNRTDTRPTCVPFGLSDFALATRMPAPTQHSLANRENLPAAKERWLVNHELPLAFPDHVRGQPCR